MTTRTERLSDLIRDEVSRLIQRELHDPRVGFVTITGADVSPDLRNVRLFVSVLGDETRRQQSLTALNGARGFFQRSLFKNLRLRNALNLAFRHDDSIDRGQRIEDLLRSIRTDPAPGDGGEEE